MEDVCGNAEGALPTAEAAEGDSAGGNDESRYSLSCGLRRVSNWFFSWAISMFFALSSASVSRTCGENGGEGRMREREKML